MKTAESFDLIYSFYYAYLYFSHHFLIVNMMMELVKFSF